MERGCITLKDIISLDGNIINYIEYKNTFGPYNGDFLDYNIIRNGVGGLNLGNLENTDKIVFKDTLVGKLGRKSFFTEINSTESPLCVELWNRKYGITISRENWNLVHQLKESKLKALTFKILHGIYPSNELLFKMELSGSPMCTLCNQRDTLEHFFFHCEKIKPLWEKVITEINLYMGIRIKLNEKVVLLGANVIPRRRSKQVSQINHVLAVAKSAISKFRYGPERPLLDIYETDSNVRGIWQGYQ